MKLDFVEASRRAGTIQAPNAQCEALSYRTGRLPGVRAGMFFNHLNQAEAEQVLKGAATISEDKPGTPRSRKDRYS